MIDSSPLEYRAHTFWCQWLLLLSGSECTSFWIIFIYYGDCLFHPSSSAPKLLSRFLMWGFRSSFSSLRLVACSCPDLLPWQGPAPPNSLSGDTGACPLASSLFSHLMWLLTLVGGD